eukprot:gene9217-10178_t
MFLVRSWLRFLYNSDLDDVDYPRIQEIATEVNGQFSKDYSTWLKDCVQQEVITEMSPATTEMQLLQAPTPSRPIKCGYLRKLGGQVRNWKMRFFVAANASDNYLVTYFEDETREKEKGHILCSGYQVERFSRDEEKSYGGPGFKLVPHGIGGIGGGGHHNSRRIWYLRADNPADLNTWMTIFSLACQRALPVSPLQDPQRLRLHRDVIQHALRSTRSCYGYFGVAPGPSAGTEEELLTSLTKAILWREVLADYFALSPSAEGETGAAGVGSSSPSGMEARREHVLQTVHHLVSPVVQAALKTCLSNVETIDAYQASVTRQKELLQAKEEEVERCLDEQMSNLVSGLQYDLKYDICKPVLTRLYTDLTAAHIEGLRAFLQMLCTSFDREVFSSKEALGLWIDQLDANLTDPSNEQNPLCEACNLLWKMYTNHLLEGEVAVLLTSAGMSSYCLYTDSLADLQRWASNALHTLRNTLAAEVEKDPVHNPRESMLGAMQDLLARLKHDVQLSLHHRLMAILRDAMEVKVQELLIAPALDLVYAAQPLVTHSSIALFLPCVGERMVRKRIDIFLTDLLLSYDEDIVRQLGEAKLAGKIQELLLSGENVE